MNDQLTVAIMITSRNRAQDLSRTLKAVQSLIPKPDELLITLDGCSDESEDVVRMLSEDAQLFINTKGAGSVASHDNMLRHAQSDLVLSLDDDSYPEQVDAIDRLRLIFSEDEDIAVAHFPQRSDEYPATLSQTSFGPRRLTSTFANSGACYRRRTYLSLPGFYKPFFHAYEEPDYALQCIANNQKIIFEPRITVRHHYTSVQRNQLRTHHQHARNELWSAILRCPFPQVIPVMAYRIIRQFQFACGYRFSWIIWEPVWWLRAVLGFRECIGARNPVLWSRYSEWIKLGRRHKKKIGEGVRADKSSLSC